MSTELPQPKRGCSKIAIVFLLLLACVVVAAGCFAGFTIYNQLTSTETAKVFIRNAEAGYRDLNTALSSIDRANATVFESGDSFLRSNATTGSNMQPQLDQMTKAGEAAKEVSSKLLKSLPAAGPAEELKKELDAYLQAAETYSADYLETVTYLNNAMPVYDQIYEISKLANPHKTITTISDIEENVAFITKNKVEVDKLSTDLNKIDAPATVGDFHKKLTTFIADLQTLYTDTIKNVTDMISAYNAKNGTAMNAASSTQTKANETFTSKTQAAGKEFDAFKATQAKKFGESSDKLAEQKAKLDKSFAAAKQQFGL